jgi:hypothetical protein
VAIAGALTLSVVVALTVALKIRSRPASAGKVATASLAPQRVELQAQRPAAVACPQASSPAGLARQMHGTRVAFVSTPTQAARRAHNEGKLTFLLHVSGNFEDPDFT